jgi:hypothetical protein
MDPSLHWPGTSCGENSGQDQMVRCFAGPVIGRVPKRISVHVATVLISFQSCLNAELVKNLDMYISEIMAYLFDVMSLKV